MVDLTLPLVIAVRDTSGVDGTFSTIVNTLTGHFWQGAELQWLNDSPDISCIPSGSQDPSGQYLVSMQPHPKHGNLGDFVNKPGLCYEIMNVLNRSAILIHPGDYAGQASAGERSDFLGCMGLGKQRGKLVPPGFSASQEVIEVSVQAISEFYKEMGGNDFRLLIINNF